MPAPRLPYVFAGPLRTTRLILRTMTSDDVDDIYSYQSRADVCRYLPFAPRTREEVAEKVAAYSMARALNGDGDFWELAIERANDVGRVIGDVYFTINSVANATAEIGWTVHPLFAGQGYMTEAAGAVLEVAFGQLGLHRVYAKLAPRNDASVALCKRLGMREEACFVEDVWFKDAWGDTAIYAILEREWTARASETQRRCLPDPRASASSNDANHAADCYEHLPRQAVPAARRSSDRQVTRDGGQDRPLMSARGDAVIGRVESVNVGEPRPVEVDGHTVWTAIWKSPVEGRVPLRGVNLRGDDQADRTVHGGPDKAVYAYAVEDTAWWEAQLGGPLGAGAFGENLTVRGLPVSEAVIGERWAVGGAVLEVAQPRLPCFKLGLRMGDPRFLKRFAAAGRPGAYLRVVHEGDIGAGDQIDVVSRPAHGVTSALVSRALLREPQLLAAALQAPELPAGLRGWMQERAGKLPQRGV
ncbi:MAG: GNAT family N-acetyltransferase [Solirubrobacteraceae bacterium]